MDASVVPCLLLAGFITSTLANELTYVSEYLSKTPQKLSKYSWFGSARLHQFQVPEDTVLARWLLIVTKGTGSNCGKHNVTIHFRAGAPPVINPVGTQFAKNTAFLPAQNLTLVVSSGQSIAFFNITNPAPGDWFIAAHLPKDDGKIEQKGFSPTCTYFFQPQMFVRRAVDLPVLERNVPLRLSLSYPDKTAFMKIFVPDYTSEVTFHISGCVTENITDKVCPLVLTLGAVALTDSTVRTVNCSGNVTCTAQLPTPPWGTWVRVSADSIHPNLTTAFTITANLTGGCKPKSTGQLKDLFAQLSSNNSSPSLNASAGFGNITALGESWLPSGNSSARRDPFGSACVRYEPVFREDMDVVSTRFALVGGPNVTLTSRAPTLVSFNLKSLTDSGGTLVLDLKLNKANLTNRNSSVVACLTTRSPVLSLNSTQTCTTAFSQGHLLRMNVTAPEATLQIPFPEAAWWYLTLQIVCPQNDSDGGAAWGTVITSMYLSACVDDCGTYGECRLLRSNGYLYASCVCKAGWAGWSCTDDGTAQSYGRQLAAALLLTLSNLLFIPPIVLAMYRCYLVEASVYLFTMFFSTFYHACDQPGVTVLCIMDYDTLQYCDFLGSVCSIWVTILCMARIKDTFKYTLFMLGTLIIAMSMQLDRRGLWNLLGPVLCAVLAMVAAWIYRGVRRRQCYPKTWKRWVFYLLPGIATAVIGLCVYVFTETDDNYYYTHSIWHIMVASSVVFLLPPREKYNPPWGWSRSFFCGYQLCRNEKDELYTVT